MGEYRNTRSNVYQKGNKRIFDIVLSFLILTAMIPVLIVVGLVIKIRLGSPVFFKQKRPGLNGEIFTIYKFRTMTNEKDDQGNLLPNHARITKLGKFLRATSLDELPELFNVLKGDMSLVGPRPLLVEYLPLYNDYQNRRHEVRPGITGLAQVNGRNAISWAERFDFDIQYVDNVSLLLDCKILCKTVLTVFKRKGVNASNTVTMEKFRGQEDSMYF